MNEGDAKEAKNLALVGAKDFLSYSSIRECDIEVDSLVILLQAKALQGTRSRDSLI